ncbi:MAG: hypothetical protein OEY97_05155 [Nitrospirota bacterium]|nr:hypothetical protein [Nitrospirota bacterium]
MQRGTVVLRILCGLALVISTACKPSEPPPPPKVEAPPPVAAPPAAKKPDPVAQVVKKGGGWVLELTPPMQDALQRTHPYFKAWEMGDFFAPSVAHYKITRRQVPWGVVADFNGDGISDAMLMGRDATYRMRVAILSGPDGFQVQTLSRSRFQEIEGRKGLETYVMYHPPGVVREYLDPEFGDDESGSGWKKRKVPHEAFKEVYDEVGGTVYYFEEGNWKDVVPAR